MTAGLPAAATHTHAPHPQHGGGHLHHHGHSSESALLRAFVLIAGFMGVEIVAGLLTNSLVLMADAGHMFLDATALGIAWFSLRLSRRAAEAKLSYGHHRYQVLAAFVNALTLLALVGWILFEVVERLRHPQGLLPLPMLIVAILGLIVNLIAYSWLHGSEDDSAAVRSALLHVLGDLLGSAAAIASAVIVYLTGWGYADPLLALIVAAILLRGAVRVLRESSNILLEGMPEGLDLKEVRRVLCSEADGVRAVHHLHAWALTAERPLLTLHADIHRDHDPEAVLAALKRLLLERFGIDHSTIQIEYGDCPDRDLSGDAPQGSNG